MSLLLFWGCLLIVLYIYLFYPALTEILSSIFKKNVRKAHSLRNVSIIIPAYNEERYIRNTIENKLKLDYPEEKIEIIVVSDGSTDRTDTIVEEYANRGVRLIRQEPRQGKTAGLNLVVPKAKGEIIIFSDANSIYSPDALRELVANFSDPSVGYVTGKMVYVNPDGSLVGDGCSAYMKYENLLRKSETLIGSIVGVDGGIDAMRKELFRPMRPDQLPDFILPLQVVEQGYRVVYDSSALLNENALNKSKDEYRMRVRVSLRSLHALKDMRHLLNPLRYGLFSWQMISHKVLRYSAFLFLIGLYVSNLALAGSHPFYAFSFLLQNIFYLLAVAGYILEKTRFNLMIFSMPFYFCLLNAAAVHAVWKFMNNQKQVIWAPRTG